jgi:hypothetical protein
MYLITVLEFYFWEVGMWQSKLSLEYFYLERSRLKKEVTFYFVIFIILRSILLLSNFCLILRDVFQIYFNFGIGNRTSTSVYGWISYIFNGIWRVDHAVKYCILGARI